MNYYEHVRVFLVIGSERGFVENSLSFTAGSAAVFHNTFHIIKAALDALLICRK